MPTLVVRVLGRPQIERDGVAVAPPRGHKPWWVLAHLALAGRPISRAQLATLIFADSADPLGALRWTLAQLRRALAVPEALRGDPLELGLPPGTVVDDLALLDGEAEPALARGELLEGVEPDTGTVFASWLLVEAVAWPGRARPSCARRRSAPWPAATPWRARPSPRARSPSTATTRASTSCSSAVWRGPARCARRAGTPRPARRSSAAISGAAPIRAYGAPPGTTIPPGPPSATGRRRPVPGHAYAEGRAVGEPALLARALTSLGTALARARLRRGAGRPRRIGRALVLRASELAADPRERVAVLGVRGRALSDRGRDEAAMTLLRESLATARGCGDTRQAAWSQAILGRSLILRAELEQATEVVDDALALVERDGWVAFQPFPEALRAELALRAATPSGRSRCSTTPTRSAAGWRPVLGGDGRPRPRTLPRGRRRARRGARRLRDAAVRAGRLADAYVWVHAHGLDAIAGVAIADGTPGARARVATLEEVAARGDLPELVVRAALHRARLGDPGGVEPARLLAKGIDNPALHAELAAAAPSHGASHGALVG